MRCKYLCTLIFISLVAIPIAASQDYYTPRELSFIVYADGYVAVDYYADVDPTRARVNVSLFGELYLDLLIEDQDGLPLDYSSMDGGLTIDTLGSASVLISYVTTDLTGKEGQIWTIAAHTPNEVSVLLPAGATIVSLNTIPLAMGSIDESLLLLMPAGELGVSYTIGLLGTKEHAMALIRDAEETIEAVQEGGVLTVEADDLLLQALNEYEAEYYLEAESLAAQAKAAALNIKAEASSAEEAIATAGATIATAEEVGATVGLEDARNLLQQAEEAYYAGDYVEAENVAEQARSVAADAKKPSGTGIPDTWLFVGAGLVAVVLVAAFYFRGRGRPPTVEVRKSFDLDALFDTHPTLRMDDKEVIRFLAETGGEAFAAEIRERFAVPRTSLWRMIRRLEGEGIVDVEAIGGQSLVRISDKYQVGGAGS